MSERNDCDECGFRDDALTMADAIEALAAFGPRYRERLTEVEPALLRRRPGPDVWSPLEARSATELLGARPGRR